ncbi:lytic transglycosylase domain-containing protein [Rhodobacteraceae bacterium D3-12]|nr:lytic transglycosylase domain-containing protein [Rhodobacteraceae bacterium D3-12]
MKWVGLAVLMVMAGAARAEPPDRACSSGEWGHVQCIRQAHFVHDTCQAIARFSADHNLDPGFFARLIWQESRFDPFAISPAGAQGIAQFMPHTAKRRGLRDAFNPAEALEHSAQYLAEMTARYGNPGLAAVGYNGGERRAEGIIAGTGGLARETVNYVAIITGLSHDDWLAPDVAMPDLRLSKVKGFAEACYDLARKRRLSPMPRPEPRVQPWGVQLAFGTSKTQARERFSAKTRACRRIIKGETPELIWQKSRASKKGGYFMARLGRSKARAAHQLCRKLRAAGCICAVYRNKG